MPVIDTSFLVAVFDEDHPRHQSARQKMKTDSLLYLNGGVIGEFTTIVRRHANDAGLDGEQVARELLERLETLQTVRYSSMEDPAAVSRVYRDNRGISYVDAWGVALAHALKEDLYTLDGKQATVFKKTRKGS